jgi:hypothetical protein
MIHISLLSVLICAIVAMVVGMIWHSQKLFGMKYMKAMGADMNMPKEKMAEIQKKMWQIFVTQFILVFFQAWVLAHFIAAWNTVSGVTTSLWIFAGFVLPTVAAACMWTPRPRKDAWTMFLVSFGYNLILFILFGIIIQAMM